MVEYMTIMIMMILPCIWICDYIRVFFVNAQLHIDDDEKAWKYDKWVYTDKFFSLGSEDAFFTYIIMTLIMVVGYVFGYCGASDAHIEAHGADYRCAFWWTSTVCHTIYLGSVTVYAGTVMTLNHLRAIRRLEKAKNTLNLRK